VLQQGDRVSKSLTFYHDINESRKPKYKIVLNDAVANSSRIARDLLQTAAQYLYLAADVQQQAADESVTSNVQNRANRQAY